VRREIAASAQRVPRALRLQVKYGEEGKSDFWRLTFLPDLCRYVQIRTFLERPPIRTGHTHRDFDILDAKKCKEFASTISAIREPRSTTGGVNCVIGFRPDLWRDISVGFGAFPIHGLSVKEVMTIIDAALPGAKRDGRDRVVVAGTVTTTDIKLAAGRRCSEGDSPRRLVFATQPCATFHAHVPLRSEVNLMGVAG